MSTTPEEKQHQGCFQKIKHVLSNVSVEPILIFFYLPFIMLLLVNANFFLDKACRVNLNFDESVCDGLAARDTSMYNKSDEQAVQKLVSTMNIWRNVFQSVLPIIFLAFMGSWSDQHRRLKPSLLFPVYGGVIKIIGLLLSVGLFYQINMEITGALEVIPSSLLGGAPTISMGVNTYISSISSSELLTLRLGFIRLLNFITQTLGVASGGILLKLIGYYGMFLMALVMYIISILYTVFCVKEIKSAGEPDQSSTCSSLKDFFNFKHFLGTAKTTFRKREHNHRLRLMLLLLLIVMDLGPQVGEVNVTYLFTRIRFQWNEAQFSIFYIYHLVVNIVGLVFILVVFTRIFKIDDALLGVIGCTSKVAFSIVAAFAPNSRVFYLAVLLDMYATVTKVAIKSILVKLISKDELGKTLSVMSMFEALPTLIYGPLYNFVYRSTLGTLPGAFYLVGGGLTFPAIFIFIWFYIQHRKDKKEEDNK